MSRISRNGSLQLVIALLTIASIGSGFSRTVRAQQPVFRTETRLIVETVTVRDKEGRAIEGLTAKDFAITEDGEPQQMAFVEFQRLDDLGALGAPGASGATGATGATSAPVQTAISTAAAGDIRYRDKRLIILYFDLTAMGGADSMRAFAAAQKFIATNMDASVLMAIMSFEGGAVRVKTDFTGDRARLDDVMLRLIYRDDLDGDGVPDNPEAGTAFGQDDPEFNMFNTDRQLAALQTAV